MASKIQIRRDTVANWNAVAGSVILAAGEIGYETDTRNLKIGDGTSLWSALKYQAPVYSGTNSTLAATTLAIDQTNNRVGIGTDVPAQTLGVAGSIYVGNQTNSGTSGTLGLISSGGVNYIQSGQNINATSAPLIIGAIGGGTNWLRVTSAGVGIGVTASPSNTLNIESTAPTIRLKDTTSANAAHCLIDANGDDGSIIIAADPTGNGVGASTVSLSVDNTTRLQATTTGVAVTGTMTSSQLLTANGGLTVPTGQALTVAGTGTVTVPAGSIAGAALVDNGVTVAKLAQIATLTVLGNSTGATANVTALTSGVAGTAKTALGLSASAYTPEVYTLSGSGLNGIILANTSPPNVVLNITSNLVNVKHWYRISSTSTSSGGPRTATITITAPATNGLLIVVENNFGVGTVVLTTTGANYGPVCEANSVNTITMSNASLAGITQAWISVEKIAIA